MEARDEDLTLAEAKLIRQVAHRGGLVSFVDIRDATIQQLTALRKAGLVDLLPDLKGRDCVRLTVKGKAALPAALKKLAAEAGIGA